MQATLLWRNQAHIPSLPTVATWYTGFISQLRRGCYRAALTAWRDTERANVPPFIRSM